MKKSKSAFMCFSPQVMIATFALEILLAGYLLFTRKLHKTIQLSVLLIVLLAVFQLAEYGVCEDLALSNQAWSKAGFAAITFLPPLGLHLVHSIANKNSKILVPVAYIAAAIWSLLFVFGGIINSAYCGGNYVIFSIPNPEETFYYIYYDATMIASIGLALSYRAKAKSKNIKAALLSLVVGYLSFIVPSILFGMLDGHSGGADSNLPSVMCGFAVLLALILTFSVAPKISKKRAR